MLQSALNIIRQDTLMHPSDPLVVEDLRNPFATLDADALKRVIDVSKKLTLPGAQYSLVASEAHARTGELQKRWHVRRFQAGELPPPVDQWPVDENADD